MTVPTVLAFSSDPLCESVVDLTSDSEDSSEVEDAVPSASPSDLRAMFELIAQLAAYARAQERLFFRAPRRARRLNGRSQKPAAADPPPAKLRKLK